MTGLVPRDALINPDEVPWMRRRMSSDQGLTSHHNKTWIVSVMVMDHLSVLTGRL